MFGHKKERAAGLPVYMHPTEFAQLRAAIEAVRPKHFLEWGSGGSTKAILDCSPFIARYVSVEHEPKWHRRVKSEITDPRAELHLIEPDQPMSPGDHSREEVFAWDARAEADPAVMRSYVDLPGTLGIRYQFVLVDGRARCPCMRTGWNLLESGGVLVVHDAQREQYHAAIEALGPAAFLDPFEQGQICILKKP